MDTKPTLITPANPAIMQARPVKVRARHVNVFYGDKHAINDLSIDIPDRAVSAFIGPSGCGKSTFLRCINRMNDTIPTARIEELIDELKQNYCIVIVTHSMQQAARVSQLTAFFHLGNLVEAGDTDVIFTNPQDRRTQDYITGRFG